MFNPFYGFVLECEGDIPTHEGKINQVIRLMRYESYGFKEACVECDLDPMSLTDSELMRIEIEGNR